MNEKNALIELILDRELSLFLAVPTEGPCGCKDSPESFRLHRRVQFLAWSREALQSYRDDLAAAEAEGRNLMTYKYARMDDLLPCENTDPLIGEIAGMQLAWQEDLCERYPTFMRGARPVHHAEDSPRATSFETYLRAELETYSPRTLALLHRDLQEKRDRGINMSEEVYAFLLEAKGLGTLAELENRLAARG